MKLNQVVPWGRTLEEYKLMFTLSDADLNKSILGCGDGPASFNAEMTELGYSVVSIDPLLKISPEVRIFPLLKLDCEISPYIESVIQTFSNQGFDVKVQPVAYEFQKGGNQMLKINR